MAYHGNNGWVSGYEDRDALTADARSVRVGDEVYDDGNVIFDKKSDRDRRFLRIQLPGPKVEFFLDRDGIENLKEFLG